MGGSAVDQILDKCDKSRKTNLITVLEELQGTLGYLPVDALESVAKQTGRSISEVYGLASFYKSFSLEPRGKHLVSVCMGTACHVRGAAKILDEFEEKMGVGAGSTTEDNEFTLETVNCLGACALGPVAVVDGQYSRKVVKAKVKKILKDARDGGESVKVTEDQRIFYVETRCPHCEAGLMDESHLIDDHPSCKLDISFENVSGQVYLSGLYGSRNVESNIDIPEAAIADFFCPHCHGALQVASSCARCRAPNVSLTMDEGGVVLFCSRYGCKEHLLDLDGTYTL